MVVAEILTGITLVKASVDFIKSNISTCQDIGQIAGQIDDLFRGEKETQALRNKKSKGGLADQFGVESVAMETINAKLAAEQLYEVSVLVDMRFGHGTWSGIVAERAKRIAEAKEAASAAKKKARQAHEEMMSNVKLGLGVFFILSVILGLFLFLMVSVAMAVMPKEGMLPQ